MDLPGKSTGGMQESNSDLHFVVTYQHSLWASHLISEALSFSMCKMKA